MEDPREPAFERRVETLARAMARARHCVVLTGAGISTDSGIPDFRSPGTGLWELLDPVETMSARVFRENPSRFLRVAAETWLSPVLDASPNPAHHVLARLEAAGVVKAIITQNIDGLHLKAGSRRVLEVHGHVRTARCTRCGRYFDLPAMIRRMREVGEEPACACGGAVKPQVVLFGDPMPPAFEEAMAEAARADLMVVVGSSLTVDPANTLPVLAEHVIINNLQPTYLDRRALVVLPYRARDVWQAVGAKLHVLDMR